MLGLTATPERMERLREPWVRRAGLGVFLAIAVAVTWTDTWAQTEWFYYRSQYGELDVSDSRALVIRAVLLLVGVLGAWSFLALVPRLSGWFTRMGAATLVVYLFHGFAIKGAEYSGYMSWAGDHEVVSLVLTTLAAAGLALLLAWSPISRVLTHVVDPFGYAERHVKRAVQLTDAPAQAEQIADALEVAVADEVSAAR